MSAKTGRGMVAMRSGSSIESTSQNMRVRETPNLWIRLVKISGSDSRGIQCFR